MSHSPGSGSTFEQEVHDLEQNLRTALLNDQDSEALHLACTLARKLYLAISLGIPAEPYLLRLASILSQHAAPGTQTDSAVD